MLSVHFYSYLYLLYSQFQFLFPVLTYALTPALSPISTLALPPALTLPHTPTHANIHALTSTLSRSHTYYKVSTEAKNFSHIGTQLLLHVPITWSMNLISEQEEMG